MCIGRTIQWLAIALLTAGCFGGRGFWYLSVVNNGSAPAEVSVSLAKGAWTVNPKEAKTIKIDGQEDSDHGKERTFTITSGGKTETLTAKVNHPDIMVLDIAANSCVVAADYGPQYRPQEVALPDGEPDIRLIKVFKGERLYPVKRLPSKKSADGSFVATNIGEKLPEKIKLSPGSTEMPEHIRLINMPCDIVGDAAAFYKYLNDN